jgi:hypothetical protein
MPEMMTHTPPRPSHFRHPIIAILMSQHGINTSRSLIFLPLPSSKSQTCTFKNSTKAHHVLFACSQQNTSSLSTCLLLTQKTTDTTHLPGRRTLRLLHSSRFRKTNELGAMAVHLGRLTSSKSFLQPSMFPIHRPITNNSKESAGCRAPVCKSRTYNFICARRRRFYRKYR